MSRLLLHLPENAFLEILGSNQQGSTHESTHALWVDS